MSVDRRWCVTIRQFNFYTGAAYTITCDLIPLPPPRSDREPTRKTRAAKGRVGSRRFKALQNFLVRVSGNYAFRQYPFREKLTPTQNHASLQLEMITCSQKLPVNAIKCPPCRAALSLATGRARTLLNGAMPHHTIRAVPCVQCEAPRQRTGKGPGPSITYIDQVTGRASTSPISTRTRATPQAPERI